MASFLKISSLCRRLRVLLFVFCLALTTQAEESGSLALSMERGSQSAAYDWMNVILETSARDVDRIGARPTILSRQMAIASTAMFDAWAAYDSVAVGSELGATLRRPQSEHTQENKERAIAVAVTIALLDQFPHDHPWIWQQANLRGVQPNDLAAVPDSPEGVGVSAARAVLASRRHDGANQWGDHVGSNGTAYSDYTYYRPVNPDSPGPILDPDCWQPIPFSDGKGGSFAPGFLTPHWFLVKPFALERSDLFRPGPPPRVGTPEMAKEVEEVIAVNAGLTLKQKAIVEFMRDGPRSTGQSGHWLRFAQAVSRRDQNDLDTDVKLYFTVANTAFDAFIACWDTKRHYDSSRPWSLVRYYYGGQEIEAWGGPGKGVVKMDGSEWHPYSPATFVTPPFPGYTSGHSTVSSACARILAHFTGSDVFGQVETRVAGVLTEAGFDASIIQRLNGEPAVKEGTDLEVTCALPTFSETAEIAAISRLWGGYHIRTDNEVGLTQGRSVADHIWPKLQSYFAKPAMSGEVASADR